MVRATLIMAALSVALISTKGATAALIVLSPASENTAFTSTTGVPLFLNAYGFGFVPVGVGSVSDQHSAIQFDLSPLQGATILSATLTVGAPGFGGGGGDGSSSFDVAVSGYSGTGTVTLADFSIPPLFTAGAYSQAVTVMNGVAVNYLLTPISQNVTSFVQLEVGNAVSFAGFRLDPTNKVAGIPTQFQVNFRNATLTVQTADPPAAVPEPSSLTLLAISALSLIGGIGRRRQKQAQASAK